MQFSTRRISGIVILLMWLASLALPVFSGCDTGYENTPGLLLLLIGWLGLLMYQPAWFANILILAIAVLLILRQRMSWILGVATVLVAAPAWFFTEVYDDRGTIQICRYQSGYWLWLATAAATLIATLLSRRQEAT